MFKGIGSLGNIASMMGSLKDLPNKMKELNDRMKQETVSASSGCGTVNIVMSGAGHVQSVKINGDLSGEDLEHAIADATNAAGAAAKQLYGEAISQMVEDMDLNLPGLDSVLAHLTGGG